MGDLTIERSLGRDLVVSASYLYSKGKKLPDLHRHQPRRRNSEVIYLLGTARTSGTFPFYRGARPDANIGRSIEVRSVAESQYHGLVLQAQKRWSQRVPVQRQLHACPKATDNGQNSTTFISGFVSVVRPREPRPRGGHLEPRPAPPRRGQPPLRAGRGCGASSSAPSGPSRAACP